MSDGLVVGGRYELKARLGRGGFGTVWQALDTTLRREVAVKLITVAADERDTVIARFWREAQAVASLNHPNIVTAHDFGVHDDYAYLVMELIAGGSLADELATRRMNDAPPLDVTRVITLGAQVSAGLAAAHAAGLVHRDLKPANLMAVRPAGPIKIVDFGIAHVSELARLTKPGGYLGTLPYASPEQMAEGTVDGRSDLYSLGCLLYELLCDHSPYVAESPAQWIAAHQSAAPTPLRSYLPAVPADLELLIHGLLAKDPSRRPPNAESVRELLERVRATPALRPTMVESRRPGETTAIAPASPAAPPALASPPPAVASPRPVAGPPYEARSPQRPQSPPPAQRSPRPVQSAAGPPSPGMPSPGMHSPRTPSRNPSAQPSSQPSSSAPLPYYAWTPVATPHGWVVVPQLVTPPPPLMPRPVTISIAGRLMLLLALASVGEAIVVGIATVRVGRKAESVFSDITSSAGTTVVLTMMFVAIIFVIVAVTTSVLSGSIMRGSPAGRIWTWILGVPTLIIALGGVGAQNAATVAATPKPADLLRPRVVHALATVRNAIPPWYIHASKVFDVLAAVILMLVIVLLMLPQSNAFVRSRRRPKINR